VGKRKIDTTVKEEICVEVVLKIQKNDLYEEDDPEEFNVYKEWGEGLWDQWDKELALSILKTHIIFSLPDKGNTCTIFGLGRRAVNDVEKAIAILSGH